MLRRQKSDVDVMRRAHFQILVVAVEAHQGSDACSVSDSLAKS
jgi:hypothetical protein